MVKKGMFLPLAILLAWVSAFSLSPAQASPDEFIFPLGYRDGGVYAPRIMHDPQGNLIENTDFDAQNPDLSRPTSCFGPPMRELHHAGEDLYRDGQDSIAGAEVVAIADGVVIEYNPDFEYPGYAVVIEHILSDGRVVYSVYMHLRDVQVQEGEQVFRGQTIGYVEYQEYTGNYPEYHSSDDSHLHFEIRYFADANQVYLTYNNGQYASCARGDKAGRGYTPPDIHAYDFPSSEQGYTDPTDFINSHQATPTPTSTPTAIPTLTPLPGGRGFYPNGIMASYYNDQDDGQWYIGGPITWQTFTNFVISRLESFIAFDTGTSSPAPGVNGTFWSARWTGQLAVPQSENYVFYFDDLDDGARLYLDGNLVLESWLVQGAHDYQTGPIFLNAGLHDIVVEYAQGPAVGGSFYLSWSSSFFAKELIGPAGGQPSTPTPTPTLTPTRPRPCALQALQAQEPALKDLSLFYAAREKLVKTPLGGRYETLYYQYSPNLIRLIGQDAEVRKAFREVIRLWRPALQAWVDGQEDVQINVQQVDALRRLVELLAKRGDASLRTVVQEEMKRVPWEQLAGLTLREAEAQFLGTASRPEESVMPTGTPQP